jgi:hypothetical protein
LPALLGAAAGVLEVACENRLLPAVVAGCVAGVLPLPKRLVLGASPPACAKGVDVGAFEACCPNILDAAGLDESTGGAPAGVVEAKNSGFAGVPWDAPAFNPLNMPPAAAGAEVAAGLLPNMPPDGNALVVGVDVCAAEVAAGVEEACPNRPLVGVDVAFPPPKILLPVVDAAGLAPPPKTLLPLVPPAAAWPKGLLAAGVAPGAAALDCPKRPPPLVCPAPDPLMFDLVLPKEKLLLGVPVEAPKRLGAAGAVVAPKRPPEAGADVAGWPAGPLEAGVPKVNAILLAGMLRAS